MSTQKPVKCICNFCGPSTAKDSREHLFAEWMKDAFDGIIAGRGMVEIGVGDNEPIRFSSAPFEDRIWGFCEDCNGGWMNAMETRVRPVITPMMTANASTSLTPAEQLALANWAIKTVLVLDHQSPQNRSIPDSEYGAFYKKKQPLKNHVVWIGRIDPTKEMKLADTVLQKIHRTRIDTSDDGLVKQVREDIVDGRWMYVGTFSIGFVVLQVWGHNLTHAMKIDTGIDHQSVMKRIWPVQGDVTWPPSVSVDTYVGGIRAIQNVFIPDEESP